VDEVEVDVVQAEVVEGLLEAREGLVVPVVTAGELGRDEDLLARQVVLADGAPDPLLVLVPQRGVEEPVAGVEGGDRGGPGVVAGVRVGAEADRRDLAAVEHRERGDRHGVDRMSGQTPVASPRASSTLTMLTQWAKRSSGRAR
jgi:hypothetical protein